MFGFKKTKKLNSRQLSEKSSWYRDPRGFDIVTFVHGILGDEGKTWGDFHQLLDSDPDLPQLDILSWGYRTGLVPSSYQSIEMEGEALMSDLEVHASPDREIYLVGHSMGGLVILKGLVERILLEQGQKAPVEQIRCIVLYATPLLGAAVANVISFALGIHRYLRWATIGQPKKQLRDLRQGTFCNQLSNDVVRLVYRPDQGSALVRRSIPVRACVAKHDLFVDESSAKGVFSSPAPKILEGDHGSCKRPDHHGDERYLALKHDLEKHLSESFGKLCSQALNAPDFTDRAMAAQRIDAQYGPMIEKAATLCFPGREIADDDRRDVALLVWKLAAKGAVSPAKVMSGVMADFRYRNDPRIRR